MTPKQKHVLIDIDILLYNETSSEQLLCLLSLESWSEDLRSTIIKALPSSSLIKIRSDLATLYTDHWKKQHSAAFS